MGAGLAGSLADQGQLERNPSDVYRRAFPDATIM